MALGLTACGGGSSSSDSTTAAAGSGESKTEAAADSGNSGDVKVIKLFHRFPDDPCNSLIESKLAEYESLHPDIKFEVTSAQNQPYKEKIKVVVEMCIRDRSLFVYLADTSLKTYCRYRNM